MTHLNQQKAVIYCRVSTKRQSEEGDGLDSQETRCREYAKANNLAVAEVFKDIKSGYSIHRPAMQEMLRFLRQSRREEMTVIIEDISRLARGMRAHMVLRDALDRTGAELRSPNIRFGEDADSEFFEYLMANVASYHRRKNGEQASSRSRARLLNGYYVNPIPPRGYKWIKAPSGGGKIIVRNEPLASIITEALEGFASGRFQTKAEVKRFLEQQPEFPRNYRGEVTHQEVQRILSRVVYAGYIECEARDVSRRMGKHPALVSFETHQKIMQRLQDGAYVPARKNLNEDFPLRGFVACGDCGKPLTACWSKGRNTAYPYYYCVTKGCESRSKSIRRDVIEGEFKELVKSLQPSKAMFATAVSMFETLWNHRRDWQTARRSHLDARLRELDRETDKLVKRIVEVESSTVVSALEQRIKAVDAEKIVVREKAAKVALPKRPFDQALRTALAFLASPCDLWDSERFEHKRALLKLAFAERLQYVRNQGFRTAEIAFPFKALACPQAGSVKLAERVGFEPTWGVRPQPISNRCRYDRFGTSPGPVARRWSLTRQGAHSTVSARKRECGMTAAHGSGIMNAEEDRTRVNLAINRWTRWSSLLLVLVITLGTAVTCSTPGTELDAMKVRGTLRVATINRATTYFVDAEGDPAGFDHDLAVLLAEDLGLELELQVYDFEADALAAVAQGEAEIAATGSIATGARRARFRYGPTLRKVTPQVVYRRGSLRPRQVADLRDPLRIAADSPLNDVAERLAASHPELEWTSVPNADDDTLLYQVAEGEYPVAAAGSDVISISRRFYPRLTVAFDLDEAMPVAWAFQRGEDHSLYNAVVQFIVSLKASRELDRIRDRYFGQLGRLDYVGSREFSRDVDRLLPRYRPHFEQAASENGLDWRLLAAVGYQESHWEMNARSPTGVRGIMMLTRDTAKHLKIANRNDPKQSIFGGARYLRQQIDRMPPSVTEPDRTWMALAAYNLGRGHLLDARDITAELGGDPDRWVDVRASLPLLTQAKWHSQTKYGYARGHEAVNYVGNIRTYYDILTWITGAETADDAPAEERPPKPPAVREQDPSTRALDLESPIL